MTPPAGVVDRPVLRLSDPDDRGGRTARGAGTGLWRRPGRRWRRLRIAIAARVIWDREHRRAVGELAFDHHDAAQEVAAPFGGERRIGRQ